MGSNNTILLMGTLSRSRVNGGQHSLPLLRELVNLTNMVVREKTIPHGGAPTAINLDGMTATMVVVMTPGPVTVRYNADSIGTLCGSFDIKFDTSVTAITLVNSDPANDVLVEVWVAS